MVLLSDITDRASVLDAYRQIESCLPPIAGVCQGASKCQPSLLRSLSNRITDAILHLYSGVRGCSS